MSTKTYTDVTVKLAEAGLDAGADKVGWLPSDRPLPDAAIANQFGSHPGIHPLGYMVQLNPDQADISFRPVNDHTVPLNSTIEGTSLSAGAVLLNLRLYSPLPLPTSEVQLIPEIRPFVVHQEDLENTTESFDTYTQFPITTTPTNYSIDVSDLAAASPWVFDFENPGDQTFFLGRFGISTKRDPTTLTIPSAPVILVNASITVNFTLPPPVGGLWEIVDGVNNMLDINLSFRQSALVITSGSYSGTALATVIKAALDVDWPPYAGIYVVSFDEDTRKFSFTLPFNVDLLFGSGVNRAISIHQSLGFDDEDKVGPDTAPPFEHTVESDNESFGTLAELVVSDITPDSALVVGEVNPNGATSTYPVTVKAEYWLKDQADITTFTDGMTLVGTNNERVQFRLTDLNPGMPYEVRLVSSNADHTIEGLKTTFSTTTVDGVTRRF